MFRVELNKEAIGTIDNFIDSYLSTFLDLFVDSGIDDLYLIEENYKKIATKFRDNIYLSIKNTFEKDVVLWKRVMDNNGFSVIISVWNYRLFVDYVEDKIKCIRYIGNLEIYKK